MLVFLAGFFAINSVEPVESSSAINITSSSDYTDYKITGGIMSIDGTSVIAILGVSVSIGIFVSWIMKSPVPVGAALFSGFIAALYIGVWSAINNLVQASWSSWIITGIVSMVAILIGLICGFTIIEMFAGQAGAE
jgi:hypothetical protein